MINSPEEFIHLRTSDDPVEYLRAAHESAPLEVWQTLVACHPDMRLWVAQNKTVPLEILARLAVDEDKRVRCMVAMKRSLPVDLQCLLANDPEEAVRHGVARNAKVNTEVLALLASGADWVAREAEEQFQKRLAGG